MKNILIPISIIISFSSFGVAELMEENFGDSINIEMPEHKDKVERNSVEELILKDERNSSKKYISVDLDSLKIDDSDVDVSESDEEMGSDIKSSKISLKKYPKVEFKKSMYKYAIRNPGETKRESQIKFKKYLEYNEINEFMFKSFLDSDESIRSLKMSALYYDWYLLDPTIAENFYKKLYKRKKKLKLHDKYLLADYLIRTNRGGMIHKFINKTECSVTFKGRADCFYYLGLDNYLNTGNRKNNYLKIAKNKNKLAKSLYFYKKR